MVQSDQYQLRMEVSDGQTEVILCEGGSDKTVGTGSVTGHDISLFLKVEGLLATVGWKGTGPGSRNGYSQPVHRGLRRFCRMLYWALRSGGRPK